MYAAEDKNSKLESCEVPRYDHKRKDIFGRTRYFNPPEWGSHHPPTLRTLFRALGGSRTTRSQSNDHRPQVLLPDFSAQAFSNGNSEDTGPGSSGVRSWWLGHATTYSLLPFNGDSIGILTDPVFSKRCSPFQWMGPKRKRDVPCSISELGRVDFVLISHDHYDHCDETSVRGLVSSHPKARYVVGEGVGKILEKWGVLRSKIHSMDWWDQVSFRRLELGGSLRDEPSKEAVAHSKARAKRALQDNKQADLRCFSSDDHDVVLPELLSDSPPQTGNAGTPDEISFADPIDLVLSGNPHSEKLEKVSEVELIITVCPSQHNSGRGLFSKNSTLWVSHFIELRRRGEPSLKIFYAGDTGYRSSPSSSACPLFEDVRDHLGSPDLSFLPLAPGSVLPYIKEILHLPLNEQMLTSHIHMTPEHAVEVHEALGSNASVGIHWGTWATQHGAAQTCAELEHARRLKGIPNLGEAGYRSCGHRSARSLLDCMTRFQLRTSIAIIDTLTNVLPPDVFQCWPLPDRPVSKVIVIT